MKHTFSLIFFLTLSYSSISHSHANDMKDIVIICKSMGEYGEALIIKSTQPFTNNKANEFFDDSYPHTNTGFESIIFFFDNIHLPETGSKNYKEKKEHLLDKMDNGYAYKYKGTLGSGMYSVRFRTGRYGNVFLKLQIKDNPTGEATVSISEEESITYTGAYSCEHDIVNHKPKNKTFAEVMPDDQYLPDSSSNEDSED